MEPTEDSGCRPSTVSGRLCDMIDYQHDNVRVLNALDLPCPRADTTPLPYTTDLHAWELTAGHHTIDGVASYPREHMRWSLLGHKNTMTFSHLDCEGVNTFVKVLTGGKVWGLLRPRKSNPLSSTNFFLQDGFRLDEILDSSDYDFEIVVLRPGDVL